MDLALDAAGSSHSPLSPPSHRLEPAPGAHAHESPPSSPPTSQQQATVRCDLGEHGEHIASRQDKWGVVGITVELQNSHWSGYRSSKGVTPCEIIGILDLFKWPPKQSQSSASAYVVETEGYQYAFQPMQILEALPPDIRARIAAPCPRPGAPPRGCEWDPMRKGYFDKKTGAPHHQGSRSVASQDLHRHVNAAAMASSRSDAYELQRCDSSWLIANDGDIDQWRWLPERSFAFPALSSRNFAKLERTWRLVHMDLRVGTLGGFGAAAVHPGEASASCKGCRAPLFLGETRTKCCSIYDVRGSGRAAWCGPFCSFPYIPRPTAEAAHPQISREYSALWYGDDELSKYFRANTRLFNSRYAFSSLEATRERHPGKPKFQLKGTVYYRIAPSMIPPPHWKTGATQRIDYAQMYTLDPDEGFDERLERLLSTKLEDADSEDDEGDAVQRSRREPVAVRRLKAVMRTVNSTMHANPLALQYKAAFDASGTTPTAHVRIHTDPGELPKGGAAAGAHERQYNAPTAGNVSVVLHAPKPDVGFDVLVQRQVAGGLQRVNYSNSAYDSLAFPLYFPRGTATWHHGFKVPVVAAWRAKPDWHKIEMQQFYASMLYVRRDWSEMPIDVEQPGADRDNLQKASWRVKVPTGTTGAKWDAADKKWYVANDNLWFFRGGRLFQQFLCTAAARVELKRLSTLATPTMQKQIRAESYQTLVDAIDDGAAPGAIGRKVICPASVKGSRRAMYKLFLDCMAIVRKFGAPHLFITVTCNQGHREIRVSTNDEDGRADIIDRYFAKQIDKLLEYIKDGRAFGELVTYCYVIEFQKRGNPHIHMVLRLKSGPRTPEEYDKYVTARLPPGPPRGDPSTGACLIPKCRCREGLEDPALCGCGAKEDEPCTCDSIYWHAVLKQMVHLCDDGAPCRDATTGRCKNGYDKQQYNLQTLHPDKKKPQYKRLPPNAGGRQTKKRVGPPWVTKQVTDADIVPHNPALLLAPVGAKVLDMADATDKYAALSPEVRMQLALQHDVRSADGLAALLNKGGELKVIVRDGDADDAWHSNVEISANPTTNIKYLYIYFTKGEDRLIVSVNAADENDECARHLNSQHHSPESSVWKLLSLKTNRQSHSCVVLNLSYPGNEYVRFDASASAADVRAAADDQAKKNHTRAFFNLNKFECNVRFRLERTCVGYRSMDIHGNLSEEEPDAPCRSKRDANGEQQRLLRREYLGTKEYRNDEPILHPSALELRYEEIPLYYTWETKEAEWRRRSHPHYAEDVVTRLAVIRPSAGDLFYMRLRLLYACCKGATRYEDLMTAHRHDDSKANVLCDSFQQACIEEGLVADDSEWEHCLHDAAGLKCGKSLRSLFVIILMNCEPQHPDKLWEQFKDELSADIARRNYRDHPTASDYNEALRQIRDELQEFPSPKTLAECKLPAVDESDCPISGEVAEIRAERLLHEDREDELKARADAKVAASNEGQKDVWGKIRADIDEVRAEQRDEKPPARGRTHFVYARGGFGKTWLDEIIVDYTRGRGGFALAMASSGIAALLIEGARTVHNRLKVPLEIDPEKMLNFSVRSATADLVRRAVLLLWDECTMLSKEVLEIIDRHLRDLMGNDLPFGGKLFIFTGDWAQCLPVAKGRHATVEASHLHSDLWASVTQHELSINERVRQAQLRSPSDAPKFEWWSNHLGDLGAGALGESVVGCDGAAHDAAKLVRLPDSIVFRDASGAPEQDLDAFIEHYYPDVETNFAKDGWLAARTILTPKNEDVDEVNAKVLAKLPGDTITRLSADDAVDDTSGLWSTDILNSWNPNGMPPHELTLKRGCIIILLRNLHAAKGLCNGTRLVFLSINRKGLVCQIETGKRRGQRVVIPRVKLQSARGELPCTLSRLQYPVRLAFAITINKSQGQSLEDVGLYLPRPVFAHGQLYVALSRVGNPDWIKVLVVNSREQGTFADRDGVYTVNIVYPEILTRARELLEKSLATRASAASSAPAASPASGTVASSSAAAASAPSLSTSPMDVEVCMPCDETEPDPSELQPQEVATAATHAEEDDVDIDAAERAAVRRLRDAGLDVPARLLSREEAWGLAHASERGVTVDDEVVEETADWRPAEPLHVREANARAERRARRAAARDML